MYKYLRDLMNVADLIGDVENFHWFKMDKQDWVTLEGATRDGKKFELRLEVKENGT